MIEYLSLGGGIVYIKSDYTAGEYVDIGYCTDINFKVDIQEKYEEKYFTDGARLVRLPTPTGRAISAMFGGSFVCESMSRLMVQELWFHGVGDAAGTELLQAGLVPTAKAIKFVSSPEVGPVFIHEEKAVSLNTTSAVPFIGGGWKNIPFEFKSLFADTGTVPKISMIVPGE